MPLHRTGACLAAFLTAFLMMGCGDGTGGNPSAASPSQPTAPTPVKPVPAQPSKEEIQRQLFLLEAKHDPSGKQMARELLKSDDDYIWLNAATYLGSIGDTEAVPYLIKGLKHPAYRTYPEIAAHLLSLTGKGFGLDQVKWIEWWRTENPKATFEFRYLNLEKEAEAFDEESNLRINGVLDPTTIDHCGPHIRLIGIKLKEGADREKAMLLVRTLVMNQWVQLKFDDGPKLDEQGARRALVYWQEGGGSRRDPLNIGLRQGLGEVPFKERTLINTYLVKSGLYELDLTTVSGDKAGNLLREGMK